MKVITIGRDSASNEIAISDPKASRTHLQLVMDDNGNIFVVDLNSTNGTFINGQRITGQVPLHPGDDLRIGDTSLPWLSYLQTSPVRTPSATPIANQQNSGNKQGSGKKKALIWIIVASAVVLIALAIGLVMLFSNSGNDGNDSGNEQGSEIIDEPPIEDVTVPDIKSDPDPKDTKKPAPDPKLSQLDQQFEKLFNELKKAENKQWKDSVIKALDLNIYDVNILKEKFKTYTEDKKKEIIDIINKEKGKIVASKDTPQINDTTKNGKDKSGKDSKVKDPKKDVENEFSKLYTEMSNNKEWKNSVLIIAKEKKWIKNSGSLYDLNTYFYNNADEQQKKDIVKLIKNKKPKDDDQNSKIDTTQHQPDNSKENPQKQ